MILENINSNKNNLIICLFIIGLILLFHIYWKLPTNECMANLDDTQKNEAKQLIYDIYKVDVNSIKNLSQIATDLTTNGITVPGNLNINGAIVTNNNITHPDTSSGNSIYKADDHLTIAAGNLIKFRSSANQINNIEMNVNTGNVKSKILSVSNDGINHPDLDNSIYKANDGYLTVAAKDLIKFRNITNRTSNVEMDPNNGSIKLKNLIVSDNSDSGGKITIQNPTKTDTTEVKEWNIINSKPDKKLIFRQTYGNGNINTVSPLEIFDNGLVNINSSLYVKKNNFLFDPDNNPIIYDDIFNAYNNTSGPLKKSGNPTGWDETSWSSTLYKNKKILRIGFPNNVQPNGALITVPAGKNVIWIRIINDDRWNTFKLYSKTNTTYNLIRYHASGYRNLTNISPDGGCADVHYTQHKWIFMPVSGPGDYLICSGSSRSDDNDCWISGLAFTTNPWNWIMHPILSYHWGFNNNTSTIAWPEGSHNWNNDMSAYFAASTTDYTIQVPNIASGKDRLLYFIERNNVETSGVHGKIKVGTRDIARLRSTWDHPLARYYNSKPYNLFLATIVPAELANSTSIDVTIEIKFSDFYVREIGTIDLY